MFLKRWFNAFTDFDAEIIIVTARRCKSHLLFGYLLFAEFKKAGKVKAISGIRQ